MDPLTPNKIQRLLHLAEDSRAQEEFFKYPPSNVTPLGYHLAALHNMESGVCESSSGLLDLDHIQGFGESDAGSMGKTTGFFPAEMTGRSTGAEENVCIHPMGLSHSFTDLGSIAKESNAQSSEVKDLIRHSISTNFSLHSKNLTANEASFAAKCGVPLQQTRTIIQEPSMTNMSAADSVEFYFRGRCPEMSSVLGNSDSPNRSSMQPSLTEVSHFEQPEPIQKCPCPCPCIDPSLDSVPVRQPRITNETDELEKKALQQQEQINHLLMNPFTSTDYRPKTEDGSQNVDPFKKPQLSVPKLEGLKPKVGATGSSNEYLVKAVTRSSIKQPALEESTVIENSLSLSKIAELLGNHSSSNISDMIDKLCKKDKSKPLVEANKIPKQELPVTYLKDTRNVDTANSAGSVKTVVSVKTNQENRIIPEVLVTRDSLTNKNAQAEKESVKSEKARSKSPSSKSRSTLSTVRENYAAGAESPVRTSAGEVKPTHVLSPNFEYKELDQSVDWREVMQQMSRRQSSLAKGPWIEIKTTPFKGFVGVNSAASMLITTKSDSWLTATFKYDRSETTRPLQIELPRQPKLLSPGKTEQLNLNITCNAELSTDIQFTITVRDTSIDAEQELKGTLSVDFKMPEVQAISNFGPNKVVFSPTQERTLLATTLVLLTESPVDLQLSLSLTDANNVFSLKHVQEIKMSEVNKALGVADEKHALAKLKKTTSAIQLCRLTKGNAIKAIVVFEAPPLTKQDNELDKYHGAIVVKLIGVQAAVKTVELNASVGVAKLRLGPLDDMIFLKEPKKIQLFNMGSLRGVWHARVKPEHSKLFCLSASTLELAPGEGKVIKIIYRGPEDGVKTTMTFEESCSGAKTALEIQGGIEKFPIKTNYPSLSWVRSGRKEISLKNCSDKKVLIRCDIIGDAYTIDVPGVDARGTSCIISFGPNESRQLPIVYAPTTHLPNAAKFIMKFDKKDDFVRKITLFGCASGDALRWVGLATYGETALVRAVARASVDLKLANKSPMPAFVCARVNFNLQYMSLAGSASLVGARHIVRGRGTHTLSLRVDWARVERRAMEARAPTLATLTALTGPELTRHRILRILRDSTTGEVDTSRLPENLKMLVGSFEGEEVDMDAVLTDFEEIEASLVDLIGGLQELKAQIDLPVDLSDETIIIDDTVLEHHTLFD